ncbi:MAG: thioredoxin family protein [Rubricoccaceae bacterium]
MRLLVCLGLAISLAACSSPEDPQPATDAETVVAEDTAPAAASPEPGNMAPDFTLVDTSGEEHTLSDYQGNVVVLEWLNYDCPFVGKHYGSGNMQALQAQAEADDVVWLSIVSSAPGEQGHFPPADMNARAEQEGGRQLAILMDESGEVGRSYDALTTPQMVVIDRDGMVTYNGAIDDTPSTDQADIETAQNYLMPALTATLEGQPIELARTTPYGCSVKYAEDA